MLHTKFRGNRPARSEKKIFKGMYHIWAWRPSWSCDQHHVIRFSFPCTSKLSYKVWFILTSIKGRNSVANLPKYDALQSQRRSCQ